MDLVGLECPLGGEKKVVLEQEYLDSLLKSVPTWNPACILNLKMWILKMRAANFLKFWNLAFQNGKKDVECNNLPQRNITSLKGQPPPLESKVFWPPPKTQNFKNPISPNLSRGCSWSSLIVCAEISSIWTWQNVLLISLCCYAK